MDLCMQYVPQNMITLSSFGEKPNVPVSYLFRVVKAETAPWFHLWKEGEEQGGWTGM